MRVVLFLLLSSLVAACSGNKDMPDMVDRGERQMYEEAQRYLNNRNFDLAVRSLQLLESRYPFGKYAEQAQLELVYAHYGAYEREAAVEAADRFIRLHPQHPSVDYAYYMKGLAAYTSGEDILSRFLPTDQTKRDPGHAIESFAEFSKLLSRFPDSPYAADARARMIHLRNLLARHEINVANYYFRRGAYLAATNRGRYVVENFQQTPAVADGLAVMAQGYMLMGMEGLANDAIDVLSVNYPNHPALTQRGGITDSAGRRSWINRMTLGLFDAPEPPQFDSRPKRRK